MISGICAQALYSKQGRKAQFANAGERDAYLERQIAALRDSLASTQGIGQKVQQQAAELSSEAMDLSSVCFTDSYHAHTNSRSNHTSGSWVRASFQLGAFLACYVVLMRGSCPGLYA